MPTLSISREKLAYIMEKAREYDAEVAPDEVEEGSNAADDREVAILEDVPENPTAQELREAVDALNVDEREDLLALLWLGRGDYDRRSWREAKRQARETLSNTETDYLLGTPLLADYLQEGLAALGVSLEDLEEGWERS